MIFRLSFLPLLLSLLLLPFQSILAAGAWSGHNTPGLLSGKNNFLAKTLGSNMVLQRDTTTRIYGYSLSPNNKITLSFDNSFYYGVSIAEQSAQGGYYWMVELPARSGGFNTYEISVSSATGEAAKLSNVIFGDVYLCSGQSNMQFTMSGDLNASAEIIDAEHFPFIRIFNVGQDSNMPASTTPLDDLYSVQMQWQEGSSKNINGNDWVFYSAVCWMAGKSIYQNNLHSQIPLGLVTSCWGGTYIESWTPVSVTEQCNCTLGESSADPSATAVDPNMHAVLYNDMIYPLRDMKFKSVLWYQGESNVGEAEVYKCMQETMVSTWRTLFATDFSFIYVQLSTWNNGGSSLVSYFRDVQTWLASKMSNTAMITAADLGDPSSPYGDIHPRKKSEIGRRISLAASSLIYQQPMPHMGPIIQSIEAFNDPVLGASARVTFTADSCGQGIHLLPAQDCPSQQLCGYLYLIYSDNSRELAQVIVTSPNIVEMKPVEKTSTQLSPVMISYGEGDYPMLTIYNSLDVPLLPFKANI